MKGTLPFVYFQGNVVPADQAKISIASHSLQYGMTCFGGIRGYFRDGVMRVFRLADHYERLMNASRILGMGFYLPYEEFHGIIAKMIAMNKCQGDVYFRPFIFSSTERLAPRMPGLSFELAIYMVEMGSYFDPAKGLNLGISSWHKFSDNAMSTKAKAGGCYVNSSMATTDALRAGYDDALMQDHNGHIVEGSVSNIVMVYRDRIVTPPLGEALLEGITLRSVLQLLKDDGYEIAHEPIDRSTLYTCQELMMVGTAVQVSFVASVDGRRIGKIQDVCGDKLLGPGPVCCLLREKFAQIVAGTHARSKEWITEFRAES